MRPLFVGCEYAGTTTLATAICHWIAANMAGESFKELPDGTIDLLHDHFTVPHTSGHGHVLTDAEQEQILALTPAIKEMVQRHNLYYHVKETNYDRADHVLIGLHIEDTIYGELYFEYGGEGQPGIRSIDWERIEDSILKYGPDTVLVLVKADPSVIRQRMQENPHVNQIVRGDDVEVVVARFQEGFDRSRIANKMVLDTSEATVEDSLREFLEKMKPFMNKADRDRTQAGPDHPR